LPRKHKIGEGLISGEGNQTPPTNKRLGINHDMRRRTRGNGSWDTDGIEIKVNPDPNLNQEEEEEEERQ